jgi:hypothetical protein
MQASKNRTQNLKEERWRLQPWVLVALRPQFQIYFGMRLDTSRVFLTFVPFYMNPKASKPDIS